MGVIMMSKKIIRLFMIAALLVPYIPTRTTQVDVGNQPYQVNPYSAYKVFEFDTVPPKTYRGLTRIRYSYDSGRKLYIGYYY